MAIELCQIVEARQRGVEAHAQALAQCQDYLGRHLPAAERLAVSSNAEAARLAAELDQLNRDRRSIEAEVRTEALAQAQSRGDPALAWAAGENWHPGVVGIVAARLKDRLHRPTFVFAASHAPGQAHVLKGSGRSIAGFHLRDALDLVAKRHPGVLLRFGGHAMAAGLSLAEADWPVFCQAFDQTCARHLDADALLQVTDSDGELPPEWLDIDAALALEDAGPWGQGFPEPQFDGVFTVAEVRLMGSDQQHVRYGLEHPGGGRFQAVHFGVGDQALAVGAVARFVYRLSVNRWRDRVSPQLMIVSAEPA